MSSDQLTVGKRALGDVLWEAANVHLADFDSPFSRGPQRFSCDAVYHCFSEPSRRIAALEYLKSLGCRTSSFNLFTEFVAGRERQGVRYMWLLLAMHVADDEGVLA